MPGDAHLIPMDAFLRSPRDPLKFALVPFRSAGSHKTPHFGRPWRMIWTYIFVFLPHRLLSNTKQSLAAPPQHSAGESAFGPLFLATVRGAIRMLQIAR